MLWRLDSSPCYLQADLAGLSRSEDLRLEIHRTIRHMKIDICELSKCVSHPRMHTITKSLLNFHHK